LRPAAGALVVLALGLAAAVAVLRWAPAWPSGVDPGDLADLGAGPGSEVVVTGEWDVTGPSDEGYLVVVLRGRAGGRVRCHFEGVPTADRTELETRLVRAGEVTVRGRWGGVEGGIPVLRGCSLLD
jgi:hypothetical protein